MWKKELDVQILSYSTGHIDTLVKETGVDCRWRFTGFYGCPETKNRKHSWTLLKRLSKERQEPWLCAGDFNEIMLTHEKKGKTKRLSKQMEEFQEATSFAGLKDLRFEGTPFTWTNGREGVNCVWERLDRALACNQWKEKFP